MNKLFLALGIFISFPVFAGSISFAPNVMLNCTLESGASALCAPPGTVVRFSGTIEGKAYGPYLQVLTNLKSLKTDEGIEFRQPFHLLRQHTGRTGYSEYNNPRSRFMDTSYEIELIKD